MNTTSENTVKAYTISELAALYEVSPKTFRTWLKQYAKEIGERESRYFTTLQVKIIFEKIGCP
jgi:transposase-like protein